ncbi:MAG: hypothetical protein GY828_01870 [Candidatus Gracilibacteria bacterium]|nr:hypothetical protein [Candidatus Gracilibacteria bacterium]
MCIFLLPTLYYDKIKVNNIKKTNMALTTTKEVFTSSIEEEKTVAKYVEEGFIKVSEADLSKYKDALLNMKEIKNIQDGVETVSSIASTKLEYLKSHIDTNNIETALNKGSDASELGDIEAKSALESAEKQMEKLTSDIGNSEAGKLVKENITKAKEVATGAGLGAMIAKGFNSFAEKIGSGIEGIMKFFSNIFKAIMGSFGFGEKVGEVVDTVKDALDPETRKETIKGLETQLITSHPEKAEQIKKAIAEGKFNEDTLVLISEKLQKGEKVTLTDFYTLRPNIKELIYNEKEREELKEKVYTKLTSTLQSEIQKKYPGVIIEGDKLDSLNKIVRKYFTLSDSTAQTVNKMIDQKGFLLKDIYGIIAETGVKGTGFTFALLQEGIITIGDITLDVVDTSMQVAKVSLGFLGITDKITYDELAEEIGSLENPEFLLGLLYRKGGLFFSIMADISKTASTIAIESITNTSATSGSLLKNGVLNRHDIQAKNFEKIVNAMGTSSKDTLGLLSDARDNLKLIQNNYNILNVLKSTPNPDDYKKVVDELKGLGIKGLEKIESAKDFSKLIQIPTTNESKIWSGLASNYGYGKNAKAFELNKQLQKIATSQKMFVEKGFLLKPLAKLSELREITNISRLGDQVVYHFDNIDDASKFSKKFSTLVNRAPELIGGLVDKMPIFAVAGLTAMEEGDFMDNIGKNLQTLIPFWGPIIMIGEGGAYWDDKTGEVIVKNPIEAGMGGVLLGLDTIFLTKSAASGGIKGAGGYLIKPLKDIYSLGRGSLDLGQSLIKLGANNGLKQAVKSGIIGLKSIPRYGKIATALLVATAIGYEAFTNDTQNILEDLESEGLIVNGKKNPEAIKKAIQENGLTQEEIGILVDTTILCNSKVPLENIDFNIENNELIIVSYNEKIKDDWIITGKINQELNDIFGIEYNGNFVYKA